MSEEGAAPSIGEANAAARAQLVNRLQRLWQADPGSYWAEFRASGLEAKDIWPDAFVYVESEKLKSVPAKEPGKARK